MKYKVDTRELFTDNGLFVKKMQCQISVDWDIMIPSKNEMERICIHCNKSVLNTEFLSDDEVLLNEVFFFIDFFLHSLRPSGVGL